MQGVARGSLDTHLAMQSTKHLAAIVKCMSKEEATAIRICKLLAKYQGIAHTDDLGGSGPRVVVAVYLAIAGIDLANHPEYGHFSGGPWHSDDATDISGSPWVSKLASNAGFYLLHLASLAFEAGFNLLFWARDPAGHPTVICPRIRV